MNKSKPCLRPNETHRRRRSPWHVAQWSLAICLVSVRTLHTRFSSCGTSEDVSSPLGSECVCKRRVSDCIKEQWFCLDWWILWTQLFWLELSVRSSVFVSKTVSFAVSFFSPSGMWKSWNSQQEFIWSSEWEFTLFREVSDEHTCASDYTSPSLSPSHPPSASPCSSPAFY